MALNTASGFFWASSSFEMGNVFHLLKPSLPKYPMMVANHMSQLMLGDFNASIILPFHSSNASCWSSACQSNFGGWNKSCPVAIVLIHFDSVWSTCQVLIWSDLGWSAWWVMIQSDLLEWWSGPIHSDLIWSAWRVMIWSDLLWSGLICLTSLDLFWSDLICLTSWMCNPICNTLQGLCMSNTRVLKGTSVKPFFGITNKDRELKFQHNMGTWVEHVLCKCGLCNANIGRVINVFIYTVTLFLAPFCHMWLGHNRLEFEI